MEKNIKKSIVVIMIIAIASFVLTATVSAGGDPIKNGIQGTYAVAGGGTGLLALFGFDQSQYPNGATLTFGPYWGISVVVEGILTLNHDGTGTKNDTVIVQTQPNHLLPSDPAFDPLMTQPWIGEQTIDANIKYTATKDGTIIIATDGPTYGTWISGPLKDVTMPNAPASWRCRVTPDQKALTCVRILSAGDAGNGAQIINSDFFVAIWQH